jgi:hypothetical protein
MVNITNDVISQADKVVPNIATNVRDVLVRPTPVVDIHTNNSTTENTSVHICDCTLANQPVECGCNTAKDKKMIEIYDRKYKGTFPFWLIPLIVIGALLIAVLLWFTMRGDKPKIGEPNQARPYSEANQV